MSVGNPTNWVRTVTFQKVAHTWDAVAGALSYRVYRKPSGEPSAIYVLQWEGSDTAWADSVAAYDLSVFGSEPLAAYNYKLVAVDDDGESAGLEETETMTDLPLADITSGGILFPPYHDGAPQTGSYTITNAGSEASTVDAAVKSLAEDRVRALRAYDDSRPN